MSAPPSLSVNFGTDADSFLELLYYAFTEYNTVESSEFKEEIAPLKEKLRGLADTDEESDEYMDIVSAFARPMSVRDIWKASRLEGDL